MQTLKKVKSNFLFVFLASNSFNEKIESFSSKFKSPKKFFQAKFEKIQKLLFLFFSTFTDLNKNIFFLQN